VDPARQAERVEDLREAEREERVVDPPEAAVGGDNPMGNKDHHEQ
jgi:hypothetical protein